MHILHSNLSIITIIVVASISSTAMAAVNKPHDNVQTAVAQVEQEVSSQAVPDLVAAPQVAEPSVTQTKQTTTPIQTIAESTPSVLSTQQYADMYLDLTTNYSRFTPQECLDAIINKWPERFTESVRKNNIKALRLWEHGGICATGILDWPRNPNLTKPILGWGYGGEYFDTAVAKSYWD